MNATCSDPGTPNVRARRDALRLEEITCGAENAAKVSPTSRVMQDMLWLAQQVREAWLREEKLEEHVEGLKERLRQSGHSHSEEWN